MKSSKFSKIAIPLTVGFSLLSPIASASTPTTSQKPTGAEVKDSECLSTFLTGDSAKSTPFIEATSEADAIAKLDAYQCNNSSGKMMVRMAAYAASSYGPCTLNPGAVYLRKSSNYSAVGNKPITTCTETVSSITHENDIRYKWYLWWDKAGGTTKSVARNSKRLEQKNVKKTCQGKTNTTFIGTTLGIVVFEGKTYYARAYTKVASLDCKM